MQYEHIRWDGYDPIGYVGICDYCGREISECCKYEKVLRGLVCAECFVWYCYDKGIKCKATQNVVEI